MNRLLSFVLLGVMSLSTGCTHIVGTGEKVGSVIKVSDEGVFFKTHELEVIRGGMQGGSGGFSTVPLNATINDPGLLAKAEDALNRQYEVKVHYVDYWWTPLSSDSNGRFVTGIEPFTEPEPTAVVKKTNPEVCLQIEPDKTVKIVAK